MAKMLPLLYDGAAMWILCLAVIISITYVKAAIRRTLSCKR